MRHGHTTWPRRIGGFLGGLIVRLLYRGGTPPHVEPERPRVGPLLPPVKPCHAPAEDCPRRALCIRRGACTFPDGDIIHVRQVDG